MINVVVIYYSSIIIMHTHKPYKLQFATLLFFWVTIEIGFSFDASSIAEDQTNPYTQLV